jgi:tetratricopeptide (TPR) repeat protein
MKVNSVTIVCVLLALWVGTLGAQTEKKPVLLLLPVAVPYGEDVIDCASPCNQRLAKRLAECEKVETLLYDQENPIIKRWAAENPAVAAQMESYDEAVLRKLMKGCGAQYAVNPRLSQLTLSEDSKSFIGTLEIELIDLKEEKAKQFSVRETLRISSSENTRDAMREIGEKLGDKAFLEIRGKLESAPKPEEQKPQEVEFSVAYDEALKLKATDPAAAASKLELLSFKEPKNTDLRIALAQCYEAAQDLRSAWREWNRAIALDAKNLVARAGIVQNRLAANDPQAAIDLSDKMLESGIDFPRLRLLRAKAKMELLESAGAEEELKALNLDNPEAQECVLEAAEVYIQLGQKSQAIKLLLSATEKAPNANAELKLAFLYSGRGQYQAAIARLERAAAAGAKLTFADPTTYKPVGTALSEEVASLCTETEAALRAYEVGGSRETLASQIEQLTARAARVSTVLGLIVAPPQSTGHLHRKLAAGYASQGISAVRLYLSTGDDESAEDARLYLTEARRELTLIE